MRKAILWLVALGLLGTAGWWFLVRPQPIENSGQPSVTISPFAPAEVQRFEKALNSHDRSTQAKVMAPDLASAYIDHDGQFLPNGATIRLKPETFASIGNTARLDAELTKDGVTTEFTLVLIREDEDATWKLQNTEGK